MERLLPLNGPLVDARGTSSFDRSTDTMGAVCEEELSYEPSKSIHNPDSFDVVKENVQIPATTLIWEGIKALPSLFQLKRKPRTIAVNKRIAYKDTYETAYIKPVYVWSNKTDPAERHIAKRTLCMFDTGNLVGNFVSKAFLIDGLGFRESDIRKEGLIEAEKIGISASGHPVIPEGCIKLTWYPPNRSQPYRDMRFLVVANPTMELTICSRTIQKENILSKPFEIFGVTSHPGAPDTERERLDDIRDRTQNEVESLQGELTDARKAKLINSDKVASLEKRIKIKEEEFATAKTNLETYISTRSINSQPRIAGGQYFVGPRRTTTGFSVQSGSI